MLNKEKARLYACVMLSQDPYYSSITPGMVSVFVDAALNIGKDAAEKVLQTAGRLSAEDLCQKYNVILRNMPLLMIGKVVRGTYCNDPPTITVDMATVYDLAEQHGLAAESIREAVILHEFYHYLERKDLGLTWEKFEPVVIKGLFGRKKPVFLKTLSEIAAHQFAQDYGRLPFYPGELDFPEGAEGFEKILQGY